MKNLLLKIPYFRKRQESIDKAIQEEAQYQKERDIKQEEYLLWEKRMDAGNAEFSRKQEIRENLLESQKIKKLNPSRQTF